MLERINLILKTRNLNAAQFADEIGVQRSSVSHILTGRNNASLDFLLKVLSRYPEIDTDWLLTGKGVMLRSMVAGSINKNELRKNEPAKITQSLSSKEITGDLFRQSSEINDDQNETLRIEDTVLSEVVQPKEVLAQAVKTKMPEENVQDTSFRQIEKIIIFFSDKSFVVYNPES